MLFSVFFFKDNNFWATNASLRACLEVVLWKRKWQILGSHEGIIELHSGAMELKNGKVRFQKLPFAPKGPLGQPK